ncbi:MAG: glycoside hydrolase family 2 protein [Ruminococcaceae bacterium]|nr:glycoside hydrolase family 2 protein [Oscillospiraceae bacterium]
MKTFSLCGQWKMEGGGYSCYGKVPGSVYSFLLGNALIPDPFYRDNELEAVKIMENDFSFSREFDFSKIGDSKLILRCEGLDTLCCLTLNGKVIGNTDNMHKTYEFDVTDVLKDGKNSISASFASPTKYIKRKDIEDPVLGVSNCMRGFPHLRKAHSMMGWDWGPALPDAGIWREISLLTVDSDRLSEVEILQYHRDGKVFINPRVKSQLSAGEIKVSVTSPVGQHFELTPNKENEIESPMLWWPRGYGKQNLYDFTVSLIENENISDSRKLRIGLREMKLVREKDEYGISFCHEVNGKRIFAMGSNYIPEDNIYSRINKERTEKLLKACADCNFNTIRVWGGGYFPDDYFYDLCDELGLLIFHDLMFACMNVPDNEDMINNICEEVRQNLTRIRHHASLAVISGNNELEEAIEFWWNDEGKNKRKSSYIKIFEHILPDVAKEVCPYVPYIFASPSSQGSFIDTKSEDMGDCHYYEVWGNAKPVNEYRKHYFRYLSEFSFQSYPSEKTIDTFLLPEEKNPFSRTMEMHQRRPGANKALISYMADHFKYPSDFSTFIYATQLMQLYAMGYEIEHLRRNRGRCMGALYWQLNDIWPGVSWSSIDYFGRYKALQYGTKRFYAPIMISCHEIGETDTRTCVVMQPEVYDYTTEARLNVTNETLNDVTGTVNWQLRNSKCDIIKEGSKEITVPSLSSYWLDNIDFNKTDVTENYISYSFTVNGEVVSGGNALFTAHKHYNFGDPKLRYEINGDEITVYADCFTKYVEIDSPDSDFILSDNYFDMNAGSKTVKVLSGEPKTIRLRSIYDVK